MAYEIPTQNIPIVLFVIFYEKSAMASLPERFTSLTKMESSQVLSQKFKKELEKGKSFFKYSCSQF